MLSPEVREALERAMSDALVQMNEEELDRAHRFCVKQLAEVEGEIARRKQEQPEQEGGFAA